MFDVQLLATTVAMTIGFVSALPPRQIVNRLQELRSKRARRGAVRRHMRAAGRAQGRSTP